MKNATPKPETQALAVQEHLPIARPAASIDAVDILRAAVQGGITEANVAVVERMAALVERQQDRQAERDYALALAALQKECSNVVATKDVDGKFRYAPFLDIWNAVRPQVEKNGFTLQWDQEHLGDRVKKKLTLLHTAGHKTTREWTIRLGSNAPGTPTGSQAPVLDEIADSRAKRRLLMDALNIVVDAVTPAEDVGDGTLASAEETDKLFNRLVALGGNSEASQKRFLALAGVQAWNQIPKVSLPILERLMTEKERTAKRKAPEPAAAPPKAPPASPAPAPPSSQPPPDAAPVAPAQPPKPPPGEADRRRTLVADLWKLTAPYRPADEKVWTSTRAWLNEMNLLEADRTVSQCSVEELQAMVTTIQTM